MAPGRARKAANEVDPHAFAATLTRAGLDTLDFGFAIFDGDLRLVAHNKAFRTLRGYPPALCKPRTELVAFYRYNARRGDYGPGDIELHVQSRLVRVRARHAHELEHTTTGGQVLAVRYTPIEHGGLVLTYADITARKAAEALAERTQTELKVALDNMPGALVYTDDDLRIVLATTASARCTRRRANCWSPAGPTSSSCATSPTTATTARATSSHGRAARREPAQSVGRALRGPHAGRSGVPHPPPHGRRRRRGDGDDRRHRAEARRGERSRARRRRSTSRSTTCPARWSTPTTTSTSSSATSASRTCIPLRASCSAGPALHRLPAVSRRERLLRRRRRRGAGRQAGREPAQSVQPAFEDRAPDGRVYPPCAASSTPAAW